MTYMKAVEAGADIIDTAMSPFSMGTSQPATEVMVEAFKGTEYDTGLDQNLLAEIAAYFQPMREEALKSGLMNTKVLGVNIKTLLYQVPGGMLSNLVSQLKEAGAEDKYQAVLEEIPKVRKDFGEPPLVTPSSQIVGTQAVLNVLQGERYKMITKESKKVLMGEFGQTIKPFNPEVQKKAIGDATPITCRPADLIEPQLEKFKNDPVVQQYKQQDEDVLSYALFPAVATEFFKYREAQQLIGSDADILICTKSDLVVRDIDLLKKLGRVTVSWSINTLDENFKNDMDSASSIEHRIAAMKQVYEAGIRTVCFVSPVFPGITDFEAIFERVKDQCDLFWLENLNLRGGFKKTIMDYIAGKYPDLVPLYDEIYNKHNRSYFEALEVKAEKMAKKYDCAFVDNEMPYGRVPQGHPVIVDYFYHEEIRGTENTGKRNR